MIDKTNVLKAFERLLHIMDELREQCPWDKKQTMQSLRHLTIEEVYELGEALLDNDDEEIKKELGDLLLHIVFYSKIASETNRFDLAAVCHEICEKLIIRHPHIYGDLTVKDEEEVKRNWEKTKLSEGQKSVLSGVPKQLPAMVKAYRIQDKASSIGFDWKHRDQVFEKVKEEIEEFEVSSQSNDKKEMEAEFGDILFSLINYARAVGIEPEAALELTNKKFITRFEYIEKHIQKPISEATIEEMNTLWNKAKESCQKGKNQ